MRLGAIVAARRAEELSARRALALARTALREVEAALRAASAWANQMAHVLAEAERAARRSVARTAGSLARESAFRARCRDEHSRAQAALARSHERWRQAGGVLEAARAALEEAIRRREAAEEEVRRARRAAARHRMRREQAAIEDRPSGGSR